MMKEEFEALLGEEVPLEDYTDIEDVYVAFERFPDKQSIVEFYKKHGMDGIKALHRALGKIHENIDAIVDCRNRIEAIKTTITGLRDEIEEDAIVYGLSYHWVTSIIGPRPFGE